MGRERRRVRVVRCARAAGRRGRAAQRGAVVARTPPHGPRLTTAPGLQRRLTAVESANPPPPWRVNDGADATGRIATRAPDRERTGGDSLAQEPAGGWRVRRSPGAL